jgi:protein involved in polysaccharide export with SLBB domain
MIKHLALILAILVSALAPSLQAQNKELPLKAGDQIGLQISGIPPEEVPQISHLYRISEQGTISLLYLNEVQASGIKPSELERKIAGLYKSSEIYTHPTISVSVDTTGTERVVTVGGAVQKPGPVAYRSGINIAAAIDMAGGKTPFGNMKKVKLVRSGKEYGPLDLSKTSNRDNEMLLEPGDRIVVPD